MKNTLDIIKEKFNSIKENFLFKAKRVRPQSISLFLLLVCALLMLGLSRFWDPVIAAKVSRRGEDETSGAQGDRNSGDYAIIGGYSSLGDDFNNVQRPFDSGSAGAGGGSGIPGGNGGSGNNGKPITASPEPVSLALFLLGGAVLAGAKKLRNS